MPEAIEGELLAVETVSPECAPTGPIREMDAPYERERSTPTARECLRSGLWRLVQPVCGFRRIPPFRFNSAGTAFWWRGCVWGVHP